MTWHFYEQFILHQLILSCLISKIWIFVLDGSRGMDYVSKQNII